jgi:hypothetical protein
VARENGVVTNPPEAEKFIHFQLDQMSARNEHHRFEEVCFRVARRRLSSNVKLASGPVSAGGDQGRDVESFVTWLPEQLPHAKGYVARVSDKPVIVACTLQKTDLPAKVKADVAKICEEPTREEEVAADQPADPAPFTAADQAPAGAADVESEISPGPRSPYIAFCSVVSIPTAKQHELQQWARDTYGAHLEIFDGLVLSSMLAEFDLVWVAQEYLDLPSQLVPDFPGEDPAPAWYRDLLTRARRGELQANSLGDLAQMRPGLRHATFDEDAKADLHEWLEQMTRFLDADSGVPEGAAMSARYEIAVAHIRGLESLTAVEGAIRDFVRSAAAGTSLSMLDDAQVLLLYMAGAMMRGVDKDTSTVQPTEMAAMHEDLVAAVVALRAANDAATYPVRNARLIQLEARLAMHVPYDQIRPIDASADAVVGDGAAVAVNDEAVLTADDASAVGDLDRLMGLLVELVGVLPSIPALPIESLAAQFEFLVPVLVDTKDYEIVRDGLDDAMARLEGDSAAADRARNRALTFLKQDRPHDALREFHAAKMKWWHGDTLRGSLLAMRMIARIYDSLGMTLAAKQYRCTAASLAVTSIETGNDHGPGHMGALAADAYAEVMDAAYHQGSWIDAAALGQVAVLVRHALVADPFDHDRHPHVLQLLDFDLSSCILAARNYWPALEHVVMTAVGTTGWEEGLLEVVDELKDAWAARSEDDFNNSVDEQMCGAPFSDAGPTRTITFAGMGTRWFVEVANEHTAVLAAERFCAAAQILLCELTHMDPLLVPQDVRVSVRLGKPLGTDQRVRINPDNHGLDCVVFLTPFGDDADRGELELETFAILAHLLLAMSFRTYDDVMAMVDETAKNGLLTKLNVARTYDEVASVLDADHYQLCKDATPAARSTAFVPNEAPQMAAFTGPGPGYDRGEALAAITRRYTRIPDLYHLTVAQVLADEGVRALFAQLREEGWRDWHLLAVIPPVAFNYRANKLGLDQASRSDRATLESLLNARETEQSLAVPMEVFTEEQVRMALKLNPATVAQGWNLTPPTQTPNFDAMLEVLSTRYSYLVDDVEHLDILGPDLFDEVGAMRNLISNEHDKDDEEGGGEGGEG